LARGRRAKFTYANQSPNCQRMLSVGTSPKLQSLMGGRELVGGVDPRESLDWDL